MDDNVKKDYTEQYNKLSDIIVSIDIKEYERKEYLEIVEKDYDQSTQKREEAALEKNISLLWDLRDSFFDIEENYEKIKLFEQFKSIIRRTSSDFNLHEYVTETQIYSKNKGYPLGDKDLTVLRENFKQNIQKVEELLDSCSNMRVCKGHNGEEPIWVMLETNKVRITTADELDIAMRVITDEEKILSNSRVDMQRLNWAINGIKDVKHPENSLLATNKVDFNILENIKIAKEKKIKSDSIFVSVASLEKQYQSIIELSRETWYLEEVTKSFENTFITETHMYETLQNIIERQKEMLSEMTTKAFRNYSKSGLAVKLGVVNTLNDKYKKAIELKEHIEKLKNSGEYDDYYLASLETQYYDQVGEMETIFSRNDYLNRNEYDQVLKTKSDDKEIGLNSAKQTTEKVENHSVLESFRNSTVEMDNDNLSIEPVDRLREKIERINNNDLVVASSGLKIGAYSKYNMAKLTPGFNLNFSEFLEKYYNNNNYQTMIRNEKEREEVARIIYEEYKDKESSLNFEEYAKQNYSIDFVDIPIEYAVQKNQDDDYDDMGTGKSR